MDFKNIKLIPGTNAVGQVYAQATGNSYIGQVMGGAGIAAGGRKVYGFTSYDAAGTTEYGTGTAAQTGNVANDRMEIEVLTNSVEGWAGNKYWVAADAEADGTTKYPLYEASDSAEGIGVTVTINNL